MKRKAGGKYSLEKDYLNVLYNTYKRFDKRARTYGGMNMFSKELLELDRNTVQLMIDEMRDEIASNKVQIREKEVKIQELDAKIREKEAKIQENDAKIQELEAKIREKEAKIQEKEACIAELEPQLAKSK